MGIASVNARSLLQRLRAAYLRSTATGILAGVGTLCAIVAAIAHTTSIGFENAGPGSVTFWFGTYHTPAENPQNEGSLRLVGPGTDVTVLFNLMTAVKPAGLIDGTTNFYSTGTQLTGDQSQEACCGPILTWQGATFTGLTAGVYTFTYIPIASPTVKWAPIDDVILSNTVTLSGVVVGGSGLLPFAQTINQQSVARSIDNAIFGGATNPAFIGLGSLPLDQIPGALTLLSGEVGVGAVKSGFNSLNPFLSMLLNPAAGSAFGMANGTFDSMDNPVSRPVSFAAESELSPTAAMAYAAMPTKARDGAAILPDRQWTVWGGAYGGVKKNDGEPVVVGSHDISVRTGGFAIGADYRSGPDTVLGFGLSGAGTSWGLDAGLGSGSGSVFQAGVYGARKFGSAYLAGALALAHHWMSTERTVMGDRLQADFTGFNIGTRVEAGYRVAMPGYGLTPYGAFQYQSFHISDYSETGTGPFGLNYASQTVSNTRTELGVWADRRVPWGQGQLTLRGRAAWVHDFSGEHTITAGFQGLPGTSFLIFGAQPVHNLALLSGAAEWRLPSKWQVALKLDTELASHSQTYVGTASARYKF